jgi:hypothetical protein
MGHHRNLIRADFGHDVPAIIRMNDQIDLGLIGRNGHTACKPGGRTNLQQRLLDSGRSLATVPEIVDPTRYRSIRLVSSDSSASKK